MSDDGEVMGQVNGFKYLGANFTNKGETETAIPDLPKKGWQRIGRLRKAWRDRQLSLQLNTKFCMTLINKITLYGLQ